MNQKKINSLLVIFSIIILMSCLFGFINYDYIPVIFFKNTFSNFLSFEGILDGTIPLFFSIFTLIFLVYMPKLCSAYFCISLLINYLILKILKIELNLDILKYIFYFSLISTQFGSIIQFIKNIKKISINEISDIFILSTIIRFLSVLIVPGLFVAIYLTPLTQDLNAINIDSYLHIPRSIGGYTYFINDYINNFGKDFFDIIYVGLTIMSSILIFLEYRFRKDRYYINTQLYILIALLISVVLYFAYPIMGPKYLEEIIKLNFPLDSDWHHHLGLYFKTGFYPRNGMPSMHIGLALFLFLNTRNLPKWIRSAYFVFFILTALSTLVIGEHYIIDWFVALPVIMISMIIAAIDINIKDKILLLKNNIILLIIWYIFLWYGLEVISYLKISDILGSIILYSLIIYSIFNFIKNYKKLILLCNNYYTINKVEFIKDSNSLNLIKNIFTQDTKNNTKMSFLFFFSGFAGLMYQVVFGKMLGTIFGSTSIAIYIVLATYMIGLSIGSWLGGKENSKVPALIKYAFCEIGIAIYCFFTPILFLLLEKIYIYFAILIQDNNILLIILRIIMGITGLLIPTILMGLTTPILLKHFNKEKESSLSLAHLYTLNTLGAALGAILSGYLIIQQLGVRNSIFMCVLINLIIAFQSIRIYKKENVILENMNNYLLDFFKNIKISLKINNIILIKKPQIIIALILLTLSGCMTMCLETLFIHGLSIVVGNSVYAFSIMLFTFLFGLGLGGFIGKYLIENNFTGAKVISILQFMLGVSILISFSLFDLVPNYLGSFDIYNLIISFMQKETIRAIVCILIMILPTIIIGTNYQLIMNYLTFNKNKEESEELMGLGMALNTLGSILGIFIGGLLLINITGLALGLKILVIVSIIISLIPVYDNLKNIYNILKIIGLLIVIILPFKLNMNTITSGANVYFKNYSRGKVIDYTESIDGGLTSVNKDKNPQTNQKVLTLLTNGKFQGNDADEIFAQGGFAIAPLMHIKDKNNALVLGYGTGMTSQVISEANFKRIDIVDLSSDIIKLADQYFPSINQHVREQKNVFTHINDGRNYLKLTNNKYDFISMEISSIWFAGASYLYNKEYYQIAKQKMTKDGVLQQWVQLHHMRPEDFFVILNTLRSEFKYVTMYHIGGQGILVATNSEKVANPNLNNIKDMNNNIKLKTVKSFYGDDFKNILDTRVLSIQETDKILNKLYGKGPSLYYSTDNNLYLEYNTPKGNALRYNSENVIIGIINNKKIN